MAQTSYAAVVVRLRIPGSLSAPTIPRAKYTQFISELIDMSSTDAPVRDEELELSTDVAQFSEDLRNRVFNEPVPNAIVLALEVLDSSADIRAYDDLCESLSLILRRGKGPTIQAIVIVVSDLKVFKASLWFQRQLSPVCERKDISLLLTAPREGPGVEVITASSQYKSKPLPRLFDQLASGVLQDRELASDADLALQFKTLFGNFQIKTDAGTFHVPAVASVQSLARDEKITARLRSDVTTLLGTSDFDVLPYGVQLGGIETLALALAQSDSHRVLRHSLTKSGDARSTVILCDFVSRVYPLASAIERLRLAGAPRIAVVGIADFADAPELSATPVRSYVKTGYRVGGTSAENCVFCAQGDRCISGETILDFERAVGAFDSRTFWHLISQDRAYYAVGHWHGERTPNHYQFRIMSEPIFRDHGYGLAVRVRNVLASKSILHGWVKKIVCVDEEAALFASAVAFALGLRPEAVIKVPRDLLQSSGRTAGKEGLKALRKRYSKELLHRENVLIVDQAAHHFRTLSGLRYVCEVFDCAVLAFIVFVDRTEAGFSLGEYLHDSHYVALYSWPCPPRVRYECPCWTRSPHD